MKTEEQIREAAELFEFACVNFDRPAIRILFGCYGAALAWANDDPRYQTTCNDIDNALKLIRDTKGITPSA